VLAAEVEGTVRAIGLFTTAIDTPDNVNTMVGNSKVMSGTIKNFSHNPFRRVDLTAQLDHTVDPDDAIRRLKETLPTIANVIKAPAPDVEIITFNERGPVGVRPTHTDHYWQVYFDTNKAIRATFTGYLGGRHVFSARKRREFSGPNLLKTSNTGFGPGRFCAKSFRRPNLVPKSPKTADTRFRPVRSRSKLARPFWLLRKRQEARRSQGASRPPARADRFRSAQKLAGAFKSHLTERMRSV
jgi:hypothetical protein